MILIDHYILRVDNVWEEKIEGGIQWLNAKRYIDQERDRYERKRLYGVIEEAPMGLSRAPFQMIDPGWPNPRIFVGHDLIQEKVNQGMEEYHEEWDRYYNLAGRDDIEYLTLEDYPCDAKKGEKVYFHPSVTEPDNLVGENLYKCRMDKLICVVGDTIRMQANYLLVQPIEAEREELGLILTVETEAVMLQGIVRYGNNAGQHIYFQVDSNWEVEIEGKMYYAMKEEDLILVQ